MTILKSWAARLWSGLDRAVADLEDHDALIGAALRELDLAEREAREELDRVRGDGTRLRRRLAQERVNAEAWRAAAARERGDGEALELLRQARRAERRARALAARVEEHRAAERCLAEHATALAERVETLKRQHHLMRTRTAQAEATDLSNGYFTLAPTFISGNAMSMELNLGSAYDGTSWVNETISSTQYARTSTTSFQSATGYGAGDLRGVSIDGDGILTGAYSNRQSIPHFRVSLANCLSEPGRAGVGGELAGGGAGAT